jgi:hypothetical protein
MTRKAIKIYINRQYKSLRKQGFSPKENGSVSLRK